MHKTLNKNSEFTSFAIFYPELSKVLQDGRISDMTVTAIEQRFEKVKHITERLRGIFKKGAETGEKEAKKD
jgi:hypothetical protein